MYLKNNIRRAVLTHSALLIYSVCYCAQLGLAATPFDEQRKAVAVSPVTQSEESIIALLKSGVEENKPSQAIALTRIWLRENVAEQPLLLYHAGQAAELSGDWQGAVALYQQYLRRADLKTETAGDAVYAVYSLLIDQLSDTEAAYAYMATEGHRLHVCGRAQQFDFWFLDLAKRRRDHEAVARRLTACVNDPQTSDDLIIAHYDGYFRWLLYEIANWRMDTPRFSPSFINSIIELTQGITFDDELKMRLRWTALAKQYNMQLLDGNQAELPSQEATALLEKYPRYAELVQTGWAERRGRHYKDDPKKYWPADLEAKLAPIRIAAAKLSPLDQVGFYQSWASGYYDSGPNVLEPEEMRAFVLANPKIVNHKAGLRLTLNWNSLTLEEAQKLAPLVDQNPSPEASYVRAIVAAGEDKDFDKAMAALLGPEVWRLSSRELGGYAADQLWHYCGRPGDSAKRDQEIARSKAVAAPFAKGDAQLNGSPAQKIALFKQLWNDFRAAKPRIPAVQSRLIAVLQVTPDAVPELLRDRSPVAQILVRDAIAKGFEGLVDSRGRGLSPDRYDPSILRIAHHNRGMDWLKEHGKELYHQHPLEPALRANVSQQLANGKVEPWLVMAWINSQFPENNDDSLKVMSALVKSPVFKTLPYEVRYGARQWFKEIVLTPAQLAILSKSDAGIVCKDLVELMQPPEGWKPPAPNDENSKQEAPTYQPGVAKTVAALSAAIDGVKNAPLRLELMGLDAIGQIDEAVFSDPQVLELLYQIAGPMRVFHREGYSSQFCDRLWRHYLAQETLALQQDDLARQEMRPKGVLLHQLAPYFWHHTELHHHSLQPMIDYSEALAESDASAGSTWARTGLNVIGRHRHGHTYYNRETDIPRLKSIRGKAALAMGLIEIPVLASDPAYPIYKSQAEFAIGNEDSARELYDEHTDQLLPIHRELSVPYLLWVLQRTIDGRDELRQESLVKALLAWVNESATAFSAEQKLTLELAYGDIAMQRGMLPEAHKIYVGIQKNENYEGIFARHTATLRRVRVERISKDFDAALATLVELEAEKVPQLITAAHHARAEVYYDMEEYEDAADEIAKVLQRDATHSDATILRGRVQLKLKRLIEATELELGSATRQASLVPGEMLKVTLNDPTLSVSSGGSEIEVVVWATSGDKEHLLLRQFGDEKTKYRGEVKTALGKPVPGDRTLQVVGDDSVFYAYSERFRAKVTNLGENRGGPIKVASDGLLMASARRLLSANEQRVADMEVVTAALEGKGITNLSNTDPELIATLKAEALAASRKRDLQARVKPGNPIHLRVIDPDRGRTAEIDELAVSVTSSSGDAIGRVVLKETGTHTGQFEGFVPTSRAQAMAFAPTTEAGRNPSSVISPNEDYESWRPQAVKNAEHSFTVDLNDNAPLGALKIEASDVGFGLRSFLLQTAMSPGQWTTVGRTALDLHPTHKAEGLPDAVAIEKVWHPSITVMSDTDRYQMGSRPTVYALQELEHQLEQGWMTQQFPQGIARNVSGPTEAMPASVATALKWKRHRAHDCPHVVYRFRGWFYEPADVKRRFRLTLGKHQMPEGTHSSLTSLPKLLLAVDGRPITQVETPEEEEVKLAGGRLEGELNLRAGLHRFEIWGIGWVQTAFGFGRTTTLQANLDGDDKLVDCPDSYFDPQTFPDDVIEHRNAPASIVANDERTQFTVDFAKGSRARLLRLVFVGQEGPVPSLNRLRLTKPDGETLLPVPKDFALLRKNNDLEILSGDKVTVRYVDDRYVTKGKQKHERFLNVSFSDGRIEFADIDPRFSSRHQKKMPYHERLLRFQHGKPFPVVIHDADMDVSVEPDEATWRCTDGDGNEREFVAKETGPSTGTFRTLVTPVATKTSASSEIYVPVGGTLRVVYRDAENAKSGVPIDRYASSQHAQFEVPSIELAHMTVDNIDPRDAGPAEQLHADFVPDLEGRTSSARELAIMERIRSRYEIQRTFVDAQSAPEGGIEIVHGRLALIDVIAPHLALGKTSTVDVFVQTDTGRKLAGITANSQNPFDTSVPGTMRLSAMLGATPRTLPSMLRAGYRVVGTDGANLSPARSLEQRVRDYDQAGRFRAAIPLIAGVIPKYSYADSEQVRELKLPRQYGLTVRTGERIHVGVRYTDEAGKKKWVTSAAKVITHPILDVMNEGYRGQLTEAFVGERVYLRAIDLAADVTDGRDAVKCYVASKAGRRHYVSLRETDVHSGIFKGSFQLTYASDDSEGEDPDYDVKRLGYPVAYGDAVGARYSDASGRKTPTQFVTIGKGSDGDIIPFSKQYDDNETAMQTQFAMAESFLELARRHRKTGEAKQATLEFARAKQLLANTVSQFTDPETRAHAEYLLGGLTQEDAEATADPELRQRRYHAALARFMTITGSYGDSEYASKAQFKIATIYEALKEPEIAAQEFVKLAYKYPDSEHLATAMARLGTHFQRKAVMLERQAAPLLAKAEADPDDRDAEYEGLALQKLSRVEYVKAAQIFERLQSRFPSNELAGKAGLRAGQIYMRAQQPADGLKALMSVVNNESYDGATLRAEAMYWAGKCQQTLNEQLLAYSLFKRITYDFPESKWGAYARGELSTERLLQLDRQLEIERLEEGR